MIKVTIYPLTGDTVADEIEWTLSASVSLADRRDHVSADEVDFGNTLTGIRTLDGSAVPQVDFDEWCEVYGIDIAKLDDMTSDACELAVEKIAGDYEARGDYEYDRAREGC